MPRIRRITDFFSIEKESLKIPYDLECIIDDWILMAYLIGNDFIPHLPHVHIKEEALSLLWDAYKVVLPTLDGLFDFISKHVRYLILLC